jgi:hypothetical protein
MSLLRNIRKDEKLEWKQFIRVVFLKFSLCAASYHSSVVLSDSDISNQLTDR